MKKISDLGALIFALILVLGPSIQIYRGILSQFWHETTGVIEHSEVVVIQDPDGAGFQPDIRYAYEIDKNVYNGSKVLYGGKTIYTLETMKAAKDVTQKYPKGKKVKVYYNPKDPHSSVLEKGFNSLLIITILIGIGLLIKAFTPEESLSDRHPATQKKSIP